MPARTSTARPSRFSILARLARLTLGGAALLLVLNLGACGNKGPLYLPGSAPGGTAPQADSTEQDERDR